LFTNNDKNVLTKILISLALASLAASCVAFAQSTYGTISGAITDATAAAIPGAKVEAQNQQTMTSRTIVTDEGGRYRFVNLDPGSYTISASATNFGRAVQKDVRLRPRAKRFRLTCN